MTLKEEVKQGITCDSVGKPDSILSRAVCLSVHPGKMILFPFLHWFNKRYRNTYQFARLIFSFDLLLIGIMIGLGSVAVFLALWSPTSFSDKIYFDATVAPREVIAGAPSTLIIRYTNGTDEDLRNARLNLKFPDHFLLQEITHEGEQVDPEEIIIGDIPVGDSGSVRIRGVMFGDIGGEQTFTSSMHFVHGLEKNLGGLKTDVYTFSPVSSTLALTLTLPERLIAFQPVEGTISYKNTGEIDFPDISIEPEWPEGFTFTSSETVIYNGAFALPAINAGESGEMSFGGFLGDVGEEVTFLFHPFFTFGDTHYQQETLEHTAPVIPPQVTASHRINATSWRPGATTSITITYENTGGFDVSDVELGITSKSPFFYQDEYRVDSSEYPELSSLEPGASGEVSINVPIRSYITQNQTSEYENLSITTKSIANYTLGDGSGQRIETVGSSIQTKLTTPIVLESFGRYATAGGEQLGRGPLPPRVGTQTKYWIFWHISGTTNDLESVTLTGTLGEGVEFTGGQTVSHNSPAEYEAGTNSITWTTDLIEHTFSPTSKIVAVAFELGITPTEDMIGTTPTLLDDVRLTAVDALTGEIVTAYGSPVTTYLPNDLMAVDKATVQ
ncbi:hypothetical protein CO174_03485 [Candidatus Uhrbacteria bacterium CG_4_9_14_3_um_filter_50_9]|uniref:DUF11 domain-containing protein n=1 Tax=Candidatus Uhrbacteria bacterium CG_4_9_14_3_um_filter_50_9 TaxID=1975035 RepID=A0A2M7XBV2_9BACT|nr:MAG: hypothetical protein CO174_03485 [Candidatus Uhrbacteria bacterium CG_4_9_14_3_um_filter_50_9]